MGSLFPDIRNGFVGTVTPFFTNKEEGIRYIEGTNVHNGVITDNELLFVTKEFHRNHARSELKKDDLLMVQSGHIGECAVVSDKYAGSNCHALIIMSNGGTCNSKYICHYFHTPSGIKSLSCAITGGTVKHVLATKVKNVVIPVPSLELQDSVVNLLDRLERLYNDISEKLLLEIVSRHKQYEYYRDKLLSFQDVLV